MGGIAGFRSIERAENPVPNVEVPFNSSVRPDGSPLPARNVSDRDLRAQ